MMDTVVKWFGRVGYIICDQSLPTVFKEAIELGCSRVLPLHMPDVKVCCSTNEELLECVEFLAAKCNDFKTSKKRPRCHVGDTNEVVGHPVQGGIWQRRASSSPGTLVVSMKKKHGQSTARRSV